MITCAKLAGLLAYSIAFTAYALRQDELKSVAMLALCMLYAVEVLMKLKGIVSRPNPGSRGFLPQPDVWMARILRLLKTYRPLFISVIMMGLLALVVGATEEQQPIDLPTREPQLLYAAEGSGWQHHVGCAIHARPAIGVLAAEHWA